MRQYRLRVIGGQVLYACPPEFTESGGALACCVRDRVRVYSVNTGLPCADLVHPGKSVVHLQSVEQLSTSGNLLVATLDGQLHLYRTKEQLVVQTWNLGRQLFKFCVVKANPFAGYFLMRGTNAKCSLFYATLEPDGSAQIAEIVEDVPRIAKASCFAQRGHYFAFTLGSELKIVKLVDAQVDASRSHAQKNKFTCIAGHPSGPVFATGDMDGQITIWNDVFYQHPYKTTYKWHTMQICHLMFSNNGAALYSGGHERVVVKWTLNNADKKKGMNFMPRLGAAISWIIGSEDSSRIAVSLSDNSILLASSLMRIEQTVQELVHHCTTHVQLSGLSTVLPTGLAVANIGGTGDRLLVFNGKPGDLQFFSVKSERLVFNLDVSGKMLTPVEAGSGALPSVDVMCVAVHDQWMVTMEGRTNDQLNCDAKLKFWRYSTQACNFKLNTCVDYLPGATVQQVVFLQGIVLNNRPPALSVATASTDGKVTFWMQTFSAGDDVMEVDDEDGVSWKIGKVLSYKNTAALCIGNSPQLGLIAIGFDNYVLLFSSHNLILCQTINATLDKADFVRQLIFGCTNRDCDLLTVVGVNSLSLWDVREIYPKLRMRMSVSVVCVDPVSGVFAAFEEQIPTRLHLFETNPWRILLSLKIWKKVLAATFVPSDNQPNWEMSKLYYYAMDMCLYVVEWQASKTCQTDVQSGQSMVNGDESRSWTSQLVGKPSLVNAEEKYSWQMLKEHVLQLDQLFLAPAHTLPAMETLLRPLTSAVITNENGH